MTKKWIVAGLVFAVFALFRCNNDEKVAENGISEEDVTTEIAKDVEILYSDSAKVRVRITAPELRNLVNRESPKQEFLKGIKVEFLDENLVAGSVLTAKTAYREEFKKRIIARDSVVLFSKNKERLETNELYWNEETEVLSTEKFVKITKPGEIIFGYGLDANQDFSHWTIRVPTGRIKAGQIENELK